MTEQHQTPSERDITKQQLWDRDYEFLDTTNKVIKEFSDRVDEVAYRVDLAFGASLKSSREEISSLKVSLQQHYNEKERELVKIGNDTVDKLAHILDKKTTEFVDIMEIYRQNVREDTNSSLNKFYSDTFKTVDALSTKSESQFKTLSNEISKNQVELGTKLGEVMKLFVEIKGKFKKMSEQLQ